MRRYSFFIGAASAVLTFVALSAFTGRRPWNREGRWPYGWHRQHCDRDGGFGEDRSGDSSLRQNRPFRQATPIDSAVREFNQPTDSSVNRETN